MQRRFVKDFMVFAHCVMITMGAGWCVADEPMPRLDCLESSWNGFPLYRFAAFSKDLPFRMVAVWVPDFTQRDCSWEVPYEVYGTELSDVGAALGWWSQVIGGEVDFVEGPTSYMSTAQPTNYDKEINVEFVDDPDEYPYDPAINPGYTNTWRVMGANVETTTTFRLYLAYSYVYGDPSVYPSTTPELVLRHELGHAIGFAPEENLPSSTWAGGFYSVPSGAQLSAGEIAFIGCAYDYDRMAACSSDVFADVSDFHIDENYLATWTVIRESGVTAYGIQREELSGSWVDVVASLSPGIGARFAQVAGGGTRRYRLFEETDSGRAILCYTGVGAVGLEMANIAGARIDIDAELLSAMSSFMSSDNATEESGRGSGKQCVVFGRGAMLDTTRVFCAQLWSTIWDYELEYVDVDTLGSVNAEITP